MSGILLPLIMFYSYLFNLIKGNTMSLKINNEIYLTVTESALEIGRANQTVYQYWKKWGWKPFRYGQTLLFQKSQVQSWLESQITEVAV